MPTFNLEHRRPVVHISFFAVARTVVVAAVIGCLIFGANDESQETVTLKMRNQCYSGFKLCKRMPIDDEKPPLGFKYADADSDGTVTRAELRKYLKSRLKGLKLPYPKIFKELDSDGDGKLTEVEFEPRNEVIEKYLEQMYPNVEIADDPGVGYKLFKTIDQPVDDALVYSAVYHRTIELTQEDLTTKIDPDNLPQRFVGPYPPETDASLESVIRATVVLGGGKGEADFFTGGGIIVSPDGLLLTNWHVAESINNGLVALLSDGRAVRIKKLLAANPDRDIALLKLDGSNFPYANLAQATVPMGGEIVMVHHSENRFYTYDRGYVKRYPKIAKHSWMEISAPFSPGGSGCGIFNQKHQLIGLVCYISVGDGPSIASEPPKDSEEAPKAQDQPAYLDMSSIVVRLAVPLEAIREIWIPN